MYQTYRANGRLPKPAVTEKATRRKFSAEYKLRILAEAEASTERGQNGALLRRERLYASTLDKWRKQRGRGTLGGERPAGVFPTGVGVNRHQKRAISGVPRVPHRRGGEPA